jgi:hypothetical protein
MLAQKAIADKFLLLSVYIFIKRNVCRPIFSSILFNFAYVVSFIYFKEFPFTFVRHIFVYICKVEKKNWTTNISLL